jgi:V8-like Glu-specific endopeptidase
MDLSLQNLLQDLLDGTTQVDLSNSVGEIFQDEILQRYLQDLISDSDVNVKDLLPSPIVKEKEEEAKDDLEAIILTAGRPVLLIKNGTFEKSVDPRWTEPLETARKAIEFALKAVGRVEVSHHPKNYEYLGTAWLVAPDVVVTNRHVAEEFTDTKDNKFIFRANKSEKRPMGSAINFKSEYTESESQDQAVFKVKNILHIEESPGPDIAFLRIAKIDDSDIPLDVKPIPLSNSSIELNRNVAIIGYPAFDSREPDYEVMNRLFNNIYNVKRLQPGQITKVTEKLLEHNCSTLGGNSGSVLLDLETGEALGIHFSGVARKSNYAIPASTIRELLEKFN